jgi:hypothetical protein
VDHVHDVLLVFVVLKAIANHEHIFGEVAGTLQVFDNGHIEGGGGFQLNTVFKYLLQDVLEVGAFGAVAVGIGPVVVGFQDSTLKVKPGFLDFFCNDRQVREPERGFVGFDQLHEVEVMEIELILNDFETFRGKLKALGKEV